MIRAITYFIAALLMLPISTSTAQNFMTEAPNWRQSALRYLAKDGRPLREEDLQGGSIRCVRMNNYGCIMQPGAQQWNGSIGRDRAGHAVFSSPEYSIRAVVRDYCTKHRRGHRSAIAIAEQYSPWCDTLGTVAVRRGWGRTCSGGPQPPSGFSGPRCEKPANGAPTAAQCAACNCPDSAARAMVADLGLSEREDLDLFRPDGSANTARLRDVLRNKARRELGGLTPTNEILNRGIELAGSCR